MKIKNNASRLAFSLIELSVVILVIGLLVIGITQGSKIMYGAKIKSATSLTQSSLVNSTDGLKFWFDSKDSITIGSGGVGSEIYSNSSNRDLIAAIKDRNTRSVNRSTPDASSDTNLPTYVKSGINGLPSLSFNSANNTRLQTATATLAAGDDQYTLIAVWKVITLPTSDQWKIIMSQGSAAGTDSLYGNIGVQTTSPDTTFGFQGGNNNFRPLTLAITNNTPYISIVTVNNSLTKNISAYKNSNKPIKGAISNPSALNIDKFYV